MAGLAQFADCLLGCDSQLFYWQPGCPVLAELPIEKGRPSLFYFDVKQGPSAFYCLLGLIAYGVIEVAYVRQ